MIFSDHSEAAPCMSYSLYAFSSRLRLIISRIMHAMNPSAHSGPAVLMTLTAKAPDTNFGVSYFRLMTVTVPSLISR